MKKLKSYLPLIFMIVLITIRIYGEQTPPLRFKDFTLGQSRTGVKTVIAEKYNSDKSRFSADTNTIELECSSQEIDTLQLFFDDTDRLYNIRVIVGKNTNSVFNSRLLNYLEEKYGSPSLSKDSSGEFLWKFQWNLDNGRYSITAMLYKSQELVVEYTEIAVMERMRRELDNIHFAEFRYIYTRPAAASKPGKFSYSDFTLGLSAEQIRGIINKKHPGAKAAGTDSFCRCGGKSSLKYEFPAAKNGGTSVTCRSELVFCFDTADRLCEIRMMRYDTPPTYVTDVIRFLTDAYGPPAYLSENGQTAQWEFESKRYLLAVSFTDCFNLSFLDMDAINRCIKENENRTLRGF